MNASSWFSPLKFTSASFFDLPLVSLGHFDLKSALLFDDLSRYRGCSRRLQRIMETRLKYQPHQREGRQEHISHIRLNASANILCPFSVWCLACGPSGDPSLQIDKQLFTPQEVLEYAVVSTSLAQRTETAVFVGPLHWFTLDLDL